MNGRTIVGAASLLVGLVVVAAAVVDLGDGSRGAAASAIPPAAAATPVATATRPARRRRRPSAPSPTSVRRRPRPTAVPAIVVARPVHPRLGVLRRADPGDARCGRRHPDVAPASCDDRSLRRGRPVERTGLARRSDVRRDRPRRASPAAPWDYTTDGLTVQIPDAITVDASITAKGATETLAFHVAMVDGEVRWFTDCGIPIERPTPTASRQPDASPGGSTPRVSKVHGHRRGCAWTRAGRSNDRCATRPDHRPWRTHVTERESPMHRSPGSSLPRLRQPQCPHDHRRDRRRAAVLGDCRRGELSRAVDDQHREQDDHAQERHQ